MICSRRIPPVPLAGCFFSLEGYAFLFVSVSQFPQLLILARMARRERWCVMTLLDSDSVEDVPVAGVTDPTEREVPLRS